MQSSMLRPVLSLHDYNNCWACARQFNHARPHLPSASRSNGEVCNHFWQVTLVLGRSHSGHRQCHVSGPESMIHPWVIKGIPPEHRGWKQTGVCWEGNLRRQGGCWESDTMTSFFLFFFIPYFLLFFHKHNTERLKIFWVSKTAWSKSVRGSKCSVTPKPELITPAEHRLLWGPDGRVLETKPNRCSSFQ